MRAVVPRAHATSLKRAQLGLGLDIEAENAGIEREGHLGSRLADAGEHDLLRRNASGQRAVDFALGDHVRAGAKPRQRADDRKVGVRLDGIAHERVHERESVGEDAVMALDGGGGIAIEGRADGARYCVERNVLGMQHAVPVIEVMHSSESPVYVTSPAGPG